MPSEAFFGWMAYYNIAPWGEERDALHMGILASAVVAPYSKRGDVPKPGDFMPDFLGKEKPKQTVKDMRATFNVAAEAFKRAAKPKDGD